MFVYIMHEERSLGLPNSGYVKICREGYRAFGFDENLLTEAIQWSMEDVK